VTAFLLYSAVLLVGGVFIAFHKPDDDDFRPA
jgi:hypothetical protein